jgi:branched-chain amino acid transport system substrate-binding protein
MIMAQDAGHLAPDFLQAVGKEAEGTMSRAPFAADLLPKLALAQPINERYKRHHGKDLYDFPARAFTGFLTLVEAIDRAGSTAPAAIRQALQATDIPPDHLIMPWDGVRFDGKGQNVKAQAIILQLQGGHYHTVWPFHLATKEVLYPIPPWSARQ